jgi:hypothetical protein
MQRVTSMEAMYWETVARFMVAELVGRIGAWTRESSM